VRANARYAWEQHDIDRQHHIPDTNYLFQAAGTFPMRAPTNNFHEKTVTGRCKMASYTASPQRLRSPQRWPATASNEFTYYLPMHCRYGQGFPQCLLHHGGIAHA